MRSFLALTVAGWACSAFGVLPLPDLPAVWTTSNGTVSVAANYQTKPVSGVVTNIPSVFLWMPVEDWFSQTNGIYSNPQEEGDAWERPCRFAFASPGGEGLCMREVGVQIHGCSSRFPTLTKKHSFTLKLRKKYGGPLTYPVFGEHAASVFSTLILSAGLNVTWSCNYDSQARRASYLRDQYANDLHAAMAWPSVLLNKSRS